MDPRKIFRQFIRTASWPDTLLPTLIFAVVFWVTLPNLDSGFVNWDDNYFFLDNPYYRGLGWTQIKWMWANHFGHFIPLSWMTLGWDYVIWGMTPGGYHLTNNLIHSANSVLFYFMTRQFLRFAFVRFGQDSGTRALMAWAAVFSALAFSLHPLRVESVAWITERRDVLGIFFSLAFVSMDLFRGLLGTCAVLSMFTGNALALFQNNIKRLLAASSISHMGYMLVAYLAAGSLGQVAVVFYLAGYVVTMLLAFSVMTALSDGTREADEWSDYQGLVYRRPLLGLGMGAAFLSLAGIPLTAGFLGKFFVMAAGVRHGSLWWLLIILVINSVFGLAYYLRFISNLFETKVPAKNHLLPALKPAGSPGLGHGVIIFLLVCLFWLGTQPSFFLTWLKQALTVLS